MPSNIAATSWGLGRFDLFTTLFTIDGIERVRHKFFEGTWGPGGIQDSWEDLGGAGPQRFWRDPAAVSWGPGRVDVFAVGGDERMDHKFFEGTWGPGALDSDWESVGS
jgi:hypothetical protein